MHRCKYHPSLKCQIWSIAFNDQIWFVDAPACEIWNVPASLKSGNMVLYSVVSPPLKILWICLTLALTNMWNTHNQCNLTKLTYFMILCTSPTRQSDVILDVFWRGWWWWLVMIMMMMVVVVVVIVDHNNYVLQKHSVYQNRWCLLVVRMFTSPMILTILLIIIIFIQALTLSSWGTSWSRAAPSQESEINPFHFHFLHFHFYLKQKLFHFHIHV